MLSRRVLSALARIPRRARHDLFANGTNAYYADEMYRIWSNDPADVHPSWRVYFAGLAIGEQHPFHPPPAPHLPHPADGAPALHLGQGAHLDVHLKVSPLSSRNTRRP